MFNLEQSIADWRQQMLTAGIKTPVPLEELEIHLREEIERQIKLGISEQTALEPAMKQLGNAKPIKAEFQKINAESLWHPFALMAWSLFALSFFLPAYGFVVNGWGGAFWGWECAKLSAATWVSPEFWQEFWRTQNAFFSDDFILALLTFSNILMVASPLLVLRFANNNRFRRWFCVSAFLALALVWFYVGMWLSHGSTQIKIGCFVWAISFLPLCLWSLKIYRGEKLAVVS